MAVYSRYTDILSYYCYYLLYSLLLFNKCHLVGLVLVLCGVQQLYDHTGASDSFQMQVRSAFGILPATASCSLCTEESLRLTAHVWSLWQYHASGSHGMWSREENPSKITIRTLRSLKYTLMILTSSQEMLLLWQTVQSGRWVGGSGAGTFA